MAMTPQEIGDAFTAGWTRGEYEAFDEMCEQLRNGELVMEVREDRYFIRPA